MAELSHKKLNFLLFEEYPNHSNIFITAQKVQMLLSKSKWTILYW